MQHAGERAGGIRAPREAEYVDFISIVVLAHEVAVRIEYVLLESSSERQALNLRPEPWDRPANTRIAHGPYGGVIVRNLVIGDSYGRVELHDVRVAVRVFSARRKLVPGAVAEDEDLLLFRVRLRGVNKALGMAVDGCLRFCRCGHRHGYAPERLGIAAWG